MADLSENIGIVSFDKTTTGLAALENETETNLPQVGKTENETIYSCVIEYFTKDSFFKALIYFVAI